MFRIAVVMIAITTVCVGNVGVRAQAPPPAAISSLSVDREYQNRLAAVDPDDVDGHYALAVWCRTQGRYDLVVAECRTVLRLRPDHSNASLLLQIAQQELAKLARNRRPDGGSSADGAETNRAELVSEQDIQRLRFAELNPDRPERVLVKFHERVAAQFADRMLQEGRFSPNDRTTFLRAKPSEKLFFMLQHNIEEFRDDIEIRSDPAVFTFFRTRVLPILNSGCATSNCHGGVRGPVFRFHTDKTINEQGVYTNFMILHSLKPNGQPLINRDRPHESLLLDYLLPREMAKHPHPTEIDAVAKSPRDARYLLIARWIAQLRPRPNYDIAWRLPGSDESSTSVPNP